MPTCGTSDAANLLDEAHLRLALSGERPAFALPGDRPRYAPDRPADVRHVDIAVTLDFDTKSLRATVTTDFTTLFEQVAEVTFDASELQIERVTMSGADTPLTYWSEGEKLHVRLDRPYHYGEAFGVRVAYTATPRIGLEFVSPSAGNPDLPTQVWTQGETEYHHFWFPCHDFPNERATTALSATVPAAFFALSNGTLEGVRENADGTKTYAWRMDVAYPAYLVTLVAGAFVELPDTWRDVPVNYYVPAGREEDGRRMMGKTPAMIDLYSQRFAVDYPFPKYAQIVAEMFTGAMENASATTHTYRLLADRRASLDYTPEPVVAHELVHQWHGDLLAVRDWSQTWLKEGFATFFETVWTQHDRGEDEYQVEVRDNLRAYLDADKRGRRPIVYNVYRKNGNELFDRHVYQKASCVLNLLRHVLGEEPFWRGIQLYTRRNAGREVITADLERAMEEASGRSLARFFEQWYYKAGHPDFKVTYAWDDERKLAKLTVTQTQPTDDRTPLFVTPVDLGFLVPDGDDATPDDPNVKLTLQTIRVTVEEANQTFYVPLPRRPFSVRFDQGGWLVKTLDFERPSELSRVQLRHDPDVLGRIEAAEALGKLGDARSVDALAAALTAEPFWAVRAAIADALAAQKSARALDALLAALEASYQALPTRREADGTFALPDLSAATTNELRARRAIVAALGAFRAPERAALAARAAAALTPIVRDGDPSYYVSAAAATALGKTRVPGAYDTLLARVDTPSWNEAIRTGVFAGLGELGDPRAVDVLAEWTRDQSKPMDARAAAAGGLRALAATKRVDQGEARTSAVESLIAALDDPWVLVNFQALGALAAWEDARAIPAIERLAAHSLDQRVVRVARETALAIQRAGGPNEEARTLRADLDELRAENRTLRERLDALDARLDTKRES
ncbi:MAG TPA: M1 family aminopeptidase [Ktedonobacterales bacterium]|nr:M1 family aminopeptidase [Ktedonobacterales bacterium]